MSERAVFNFVVVDVDAGVDPSEVVAYAHSQQRQILEHWSQYWEGLGLVRSATAHPVQDGEVEVRLMQTPTMDSALGYHDRKEDGTPIAYIFVGLAKQLGEDWTSIASHEVLEILGDPDLTLTVQMSDGFWDREVCDRVEQDSYVVDGVKLSNFNTPAAFAPTNKSGQKFDHLGLSTEPNQVRPGGYAQRFDPQKGWVQVGTSSAYRTAVREAGLSRGARRAGKGDTLMNPQEPAISRAATKEAAPAAEIDWTLEDEELIAAVTAAADVAETPTAPANAFASLLDKK